MSRCACPHALAGGAEGIVPCVGLTRSDEQAQLRDRLLDQLCVVQLHHKGQGLEQHRVQRVVLVHVLGCL